MFDVAIITANYGIYDSVKPPLAQDGLNVDWVMVTDHPELSGAEFWRTVDEPRPDTIPFRAAKRAKFRPWEYTDAPASIWVDSTVQVMSPHFAEAVLSKANPISMMRHNYRDCIYEEALISTAVAKYQGEPLAEQADHYYRQGHPEHWGLWLTTIVGRRHTEAVKRFSVAWEAETAWTTQDQVSQPVALRNCGLMPGDLLGHELGYNWIVSNKHRDANSVIPAALDRPEVKELIRLQAIKREANKS